MRIDLAWMLRTGRAREDWTVPGVLSWQCRGENCGSIGYRAVMSEPGHERLELRYTRGAGEAAEEVRQTIQLCHTVPHYGGKRWWMLCPFGGGRCGKLYLPPRGDRFASRKAWKLGYYSQRIAEHDKPFERLFRLQAKLDCEIGWGNYPRRPKGMWQRTYARHLEQFFELDEQCDAIMSGLMARLGR